MARKPAQKKPLVVSVWLAAALTVLAIVVGVFWPNTFTTGADLRSAVDPALSFASCVQTALVERNIFDQERAATVARAFDVSIDVGLKNHEQAHTIQQVYKEPVQLAIVQGCASERQRALPKAVFVSVVSDDADRPLNEAEVNVGGAFERCSTGQAGDGRCQLSISAARSAQGASFDVRRSGYVMARADRQRRVSAPELDQEVRLRMQRLKPVTISITRSGGPIGRVEIKPSGDFTYWSESCEDQNRERSDSACLSAFSQDGSARFYFQDEHGSPLTPDLATLEVELVLGDKRKVCSLDRQGHADWDDCGQPSCASERAAALRGCERYWDREARDCVDQVRRRFASCRGAR